MRDAGAKNAELDHVLGAAYPKCVDLVVSLPRNAAGKTLRRELREPYWERRVN